MIIFPAIDLHHGCAVRLLRGDYNQMTEYSDSPEDVAAKLAAESALWRFFKAVWRPAWPV